jgi:hypothetical protein
MKYLHATRIPQGSWQTKTQKSIALRNRIRLVIVTTYTVPTRANIEHPEGWPARALRHRRGRPLGAACCACAAHYVHRAAPQPAARQRKGKNVL